MKNIIDLYTESFRANWNLPALTDYPTKRTLTYGQLAGKIAELHAFFSLIGLKKGEKVALCASDNADWVQVFMAAITYGAVIVPILNEFSPEDVAHIVNHSDAEILFVSDNIWENLQPDRLLNIKVAVSTESVVILHEKGNLAKKCTGKIADCVKARHPEGLSPETLHYPPRDNKELMVINYTSGTTGFSKGVMLSGESLSTNVCFALGQKMFFRKSRVLSFLPLAHAYGCSFDMLSGLAAGSHVTILGKKPSAPVLLKALAEVKPFIILCVPLVLDKIYKNKLRPVLSRPAVKRMLAIPVVRGFVRRKIRRQLLEAFGGELEQVVVGGAPLGKEVESFLHEIGFPFTVGYGMTECGPLISYTYWKEFIPGSSGRTLPSLESIVMSSDPEKESGDICVRGANVMLGYYKNPEATAEVLDKDGWLRTGDMGTRLPDGTLFLRGRSKTMILSASGQNIYPEEIENKLNAMQYVAESLVVERDGRLVGLVYPDLDSIDRDRIPHSELDGLMATICKELNSKLAPYEKLSKIVCVSSEFQKTPKKSIKRFLYS